MSINLQPEENNCINFKDEIRSSFEIIRKRLHELSNAIHSLSFIELKNGGGRKVTMERNEFFQMIYDRPKEVINNTLNGVNKFNTFLDFIYKFSIVTGMLYLVFTT